MTELSHTVTSEEAAVDNMLDTALLERDDPHKTPRLNGKKVKKGKRTEHNDKANGQPAPAQAATILDSVRQNERGIRIVIDNHDFLAHH